MTVRLQQARNGDGSWSGHHCITGQTFCTSAVVLTLMTDRLPVSPGEAAPKFDKP